jgi:predicted DNA-binding antitoxin AbrB/MazE fold protein
MTIKKHWLTRIPFFGLEIQRIKTLKEGFKSKVVIVAKDEEGYPTSSEYTLRVYSDDKLSLEEGWQRQVRVVTQDSFAEYVLGNISEDEMEEKPRERFYEGDEINTKLLNPHFDESLHKSDRFRFLDKSRFGKDISMTWEPTLPPQAK